MDILIVDDSSSKRDALFSMLDNIDGIKAFCAGSSALAKTILEARNIDLVILKPQLDGEPQGGMKIAAFIREKYWENGTSPRIVYVEVSNAPAQIPCAVSAYSEGGFFIALNRRGPKAWAELMCKSPPRPHQPPKLNIPSRKKLEKI